MIGLLARLAMVLMLATPAAAQVVSPYPGRDPVDAPTPDGLADIPTNFPRTSQIERDTSPTYPAVDKVIGAFRFICQPSHLNWDDPIAYPGQTGGSPHLHQWFGNTLGNGESTYRSLRTSGESTCMGPLNRSAYWMPAMMNGRGQVVRPDWISIYYKRVPKTAKECGPSGDLCAELPRGLRYIFGYDMQRMGELQPENLIFHWKCITPQNTERGGQEVRFDRLDCPAGHSLMVTLSSPECWDGKHLDSNTHRSHIIHQQRSQATGGTYCPFTHRILLPQFTIGAVYTVMPGERIQDWFLASDRMAGMPEMPPGSTFHADWYGAWDDRTLKTWTANCIDRILSCSAGALGDGTIMRRPRGYALVANPRLVAAPPRPGGVNHMHMAKP